MQLDLSLIVQTRQYSQSLSSLIFLVSENENECCADYHLENVDCQGHTWPVTKHAQELPHFISIIKLGRIFVILDDHDQLENKQRQRAYQHQTAQEPLELYVGLIVAQDERKDTQEHRNHVDQG